MAEKIVVVPERTMDNKKAEIFEGYEAAVARIAQLETADVGAQANELGNKLAAYIQAVRQIETLQDRYDAAALWEEIEALVAK